MSNHGDIEYITNGQMTQLNQDKHNAETFVFVLMYSGDRGVLLSSATYMRSLDFLLWKATRVSAFLTQHHPDWFSIRPSVILSCYVCDIVRI